MSMKSSSSVSEAIERNKLLRLQELTPQVPPVRSEGQRPQAIIIAGQPGAGKSSTQEALAAALGSGFASYDADDNVDVHPHRSKIMKKSGLQGHEAVRREVPPSHHGEYLAHLRGDNGGPKYDMIVSAPTAGRYADDFKDSGYEVSVVYIATDESNSMLGIADRYQSAVDSHGAGRWVDPRAHDALYGQIRPEAHDLESNAKADHLYVVDRDARVLHQNHRAPGGTMQNDIGAADAIYRERNRKPTAAESDRFRQRVERLRSTDPSIRTKPVDPEVLELTGYAEQAHKYVQRRGSDGEPEDERGNRPTIGDVVQSNRSDDALGPRGPSSRARAGDGSGTSGDSGSGGSGGSGAARAQSPRGPKVPPIGPKGAAARNSRGKGIGGRVASAAGSVALLAGGLTGAAGMLPELGAAIGNPAAVVQQLAGQAPDMASEMLAGGGMPGRSPKDQMMVGAATGGAPVQAGVASATNASTDAVKKSTDAAKASTDAMKKSTAAMKGSSDGMKAMSAELSKSVGIQKSAASATDGMSKSQKGLNSSMRQNPLMTIVSLIGLVIGAVTLLVQNWDKVKAGFDWVYKNILTPVGKWFSDIWSGTVVPMFQSSVESVSGFFRGMGDTVKDIWDGIVNKIRDVVRIIAGLIEKLPNISIGGVSTESVAQSLRAFSDPQRKKDGGVLDGPGGPRDDVIPVLASKGEFIVNAASTSQNLDLLERINSGAVPRFADGGLVSYSSWSEWAGGSAQSAANGFFFGSDEVPSGDKRPGGVAGDLIGGMAGLAGAAGSFASGMIGDALGVFGADGVPPLVQGLVLANNELVAHEKRITDATTAAAEKANEPAETEPAGETAAEPAKSGLPSKALALIEFAKGVEGKPYVWGGMNWGDCSGAVAALANYVAGMEPFGSRFYTGNEREELSKRGAKYGLGSTGSLNIGWYHNGGGDGHTAATLPNGVNFEMGGGRGNGQYGGSAAGANSKQFDHHAHFPAEMFLAAGGYVSGSGSSIGDMIPSVLRTGDFVVNARSTDANRSLLDVINQGASALSNLVAPIAVPGQALPGPSDEPGKSLDQSMTIHLATPDLDTAFQKAKTWEAQRALTYAGRW
ncbi:zeta toxin family protein [Nocardia asteroides]|uniref:zeta toxin family protein n=1 Tax=Nocardia asteroides TaxID=1824 RepID=UPI0037A53289